MEILHCKLGQEALPMIRFTTLLAFVSLLIAAPAAAQLSVDVTDESGGAKLKVAVPALPTGQVVATPAGATDELGRAVAQVIADDLRNSGLFAPTGPGGMRGGDRKSVVWG